MNRYSHALFQLKLIELEVAALDSRRGVNPLEGPEFWLFEVGVD